MKSLIFGVRRRSDGLPIHYSEGGGGGVIWQYDINSAMYEGGGLPVFPSAVESVGSKAAGNSTH